MKKKITVPKVLKTAKKKPEFEVECLTQIKNLDPLAPKFIEFDWELLRRCMGEMREEMGPSDLARLGEALREILRWQVKGSSLEIIGRRCVALAWVVNAGVFNGNGGGDEDGPSARLLTKVFGVSPARLSACCSEVSARFGVVNRAQSHGWNRKQGSNKG